MVTRYLGTYLHKCKYVVYDAHCKVQTKSFKKTQNFTTYEYNHTYLIVNLHFAYTTTLCIV